MPDKGPAANLECRNVRSARGEMNPALPVDRHVVAYEDLSLTRYVVHENAGVQTLSVRSAIGLKQRFAHKDTGKEIIHTTQTDKDP